MASSTGPLVNDIAKRPSPWRAYLALVRPPNLTTALADVLAGYAVAGLGNAAALPWLLGASVCLYGGGVVLNDVFDRRIDRVERPERPIPSGRVPAAVAAWLGAILLAFGVASAAVVSSTAGLLAGAIASLATIYDAWAKHHRVLGPVTMASCRGLNLLLGVAAQPVALGTAWPIAALPFAYIAGVTALSRGEVHGGSRRVATVSLARVTAVNAARAIVSARSDHAAAGLALTGLLAWRVWPPYWRVWQRCDPRNIRAAVRAGVLSLVLLDATIGAVYAGTPYGLLILALAPVAWLLARPFAVT
jgi:4-hydroxybenzoate polyprenyltransferase